MTRLPGIVITKHQSNFSMWQFHQELALHLSFRQVLSSFCGVWPPTPKAFIGCVNPGFKLTVCHSLALLKFATCLYIAARDISWTVFIFLRLLVKILLCRSPHTSHISWALLILAAEATMISSSTAPTQSAIPSPIPRTPIGSGRPRPALNVTPSLTRPHQQHGGGGSATTSSRAAPASSGTTTTMRAPLESLPESSTNDQRHAGKVRYKVLYYIIDCLKIWFYSVYDTLWWVWFLNKHVFCSLK